MTPPTPPAAPGPRTRNPNESLTAALRAIDRRTARFAADTGLACPPECGACCHAPHVEATAAELAPIARDLVARGDAGATLARLAAARAANDSRCVLFDPDPDGVRGRCSMYALRPSICRLFGFAGRRGPDGEPRFTPCRRHVEVMPAVAADAQRAVAEGRIALPLLSALAMTARAAAGGSGELRPINAALAEAIEAAGLRARLDAEAARDQSSRGDEDDRPPVRPRGPRRAA